MTIQFRVNSLDDVAEPLRDIYEPSGDGFQLKVAGMPAAGMSPEDKAKLDEFRNNNRAKHKENEELRAQLAQYGGIDPNELSKAQAILAKAQTEEEARLIADGKLDEVVAVRTAPMRKDFEDRLKAITQRAEEEKKRAEALQQRANAGVLRDFVVGGLSEMKIKVRNQAALSDVVNRASRAFSVDDEGKIKPDRRDGGNPYNKDSQPIGIKDYLAELVSSGADHYFETSGGGGASGGGRVDGQGKRVITDKEWNSGDPKIMKMVINGEAVRESRG